MKKAAYVFILILEVFFCSCDDNVPNGLETAKTIKDPVTIGTAIKIVTDPLIFGIWWYEGEEQVCADFVIQKNSIYYPDNFQSFPYTYSYDSISITYDDGFCVTSKYKMKGKDTLMILGDDGWGTFTRNEN